VTDTDPECVYVNDRQIMRWSPERENALREFALEGLAASRIASAMNQRFGSNYTRNAIIGKMRRLGVPLYHAVGPYQAGVKRSYPNRRKTVSLAKPRPKRPPKTRIMAVIREALPDMASTEAISSNPVHLLDATDNHCRWPIGEPSEMLFCGNPVLQAKGIHQWCASHCLIGLNVR